MLLFLRQCAYHKTLPGSTLLWHPRKGNTVSHESLFALLSFAQNLVAHVAGDPGCIDLNPNRLYSDY